LLKAAEKLGGEEGAHTPFSERKPRQEQCARNL
jgi:hypothetical protein